jgi:hypothetical protein
MEWLKVCWQSAGFKSSDELARHINADDRYLETSPLQYRSLGNNLRALNRGDRLAWWRKQTLLLDALAIAIHCTRGELEGRLFRGARSADDSDAPTRTRIASLGALRPLKLRGEELPPGFPDLVTRPARWRRHWWTTLDVEAASLAGRWLAARGMAVVIRASSWTAAARQLPERGRVFVTLDVVDMHELDWRALAESSVLDDLQLLIAAPFPPAHDSRLLEVPGRLAKWIPSASAARVGDAWIELSQEPAEQWFSSLLEWVSARTPKKQRMDPEVLRALVEELALVPMLAGPSDALDFLGFVTTLSARARSERGTSQTKWGLARFEAQLAVMSDEHDTSRALLEGRIGEFALALLVAVAQASSATCFLGHSRSCWTALVRRDIAGSEDLVTVNSLLEANGDSELSAERVREIRRALRPNRGRVIDALRHARVLTASVDPEMLRPHPSWAARVVFTEAIDAVLEEPVTAIGVVALREELIVTLFDRMVERLLRRDDRWAARVFSASASHDDRRVLAARELSACALGLVSVTSVALDPGLRKSARSCLRATQFSNVNRSRCFAVPLAASALPVGHFEEQLAWLASFTLESCDTFGEAAAEDVTPALSLLRSSDRLVYDMYRFVARAADPARMSDLSPSTSFFYNALSPVRLFAYGAMVKRGDPEYRREFSILASSTAVMQSPELLRGILSVGSYAELDHIELLELLWETWAKDENLESQPPIAWIGLDEAAAAKLWSFGRFEAKRAFLTILTEKLIGLKLVLETLSIAEWEQCFESVFIQHEGKSSIVTGLAMFQHDDFWAVFPVELASTLLTAFGSLINIPPLCESFWRHAPSAMLDVTGLTKISLAPTCAGAQIADYVEVTMSRGSFDEKARVGLLSWTRSLVTGEGELAARALRIQKFLLTDNLPEREREREREREPDPIRRPSVARQHHAAEQSPLPETPSPTKAENSRDRAQVIVESETDKKTSRKSKNRKRRRKNKKRTQEATAAEAAAAEAAASTAASDEAKTAVAAGTSATEDGGS